MKHLHGITIGFGTLVIIVVIYTLSYSVYLSSRYEAPDGYEEPGPIEIGSHPHYDMEDPYFSHYSHTIYAPVEYMIDSSILRKPLLAWSGICGSRSKAEFDSIFRMMDRRVINYKWAEPARAHP